MQKPVRIAAFTGTRMGMTDAQRSAIRKLLRDLELTHFAHGAAVGADEEASLIAHELGLQISARPANLPDHRSENAVADRWAAPEPPLERNKKLVDSSHLLIAVPDGPERRSGTWSTVRYARRRMKAVWIVMPDGSVATLS